MGRGAQSRIGADTGTRASRRYPACGLDREIPLTDLLGRPSGQNSEAERRALDSLLKRAPLRIDSRRRRRLRHSGMAPYRDRRGRRVFATSMSRRFLIDAGAESLAPARGTVGDFLVQDGRGQLCIWPRKEFQALYSRESVSRTAGSPNTADPSIWLLDIRQALVENRLDDALTELEELSRRVGLDPELGELAESISKQAKGPGSASIKNRARELCMA